MKVAAIQMVSGVSVQANLDSARALLEQAAQAGARAGGAARVFLPAWASATATSWRCASASAQGPVQDFLARAARECGLWIVGGTLPLVAADDAHVRNTSLVFSPAGERVARYDKIHLFQFDNGRERYDESRVIESGSETAVFDAARPRRPRLARRPERLLRPAVSRAVPRLAGRRAAGAQRLHLRHGPGALGTAAARARRREPGLRDRAGAGRRARERPAHLGPHAWWWTPGAGARATRRGRRAWCWPISIPSARPRLRAQLPALEHRVL